MYYLLLIFLFFFLYYCSPTKENYKVYKPPKIRTYCNTLRIQEDPVVSYFHPRYVDFANHKGKLDNEDRFVDKTNFYQETGPVRCLECYHANSFCQ